MADVITRFKLETTQYDSKLRDAAKGLSELSGKLQLAGKDFDRFAQKDVEFARSLGKIESGATNLKDKLKDLVGAYNNVAKAYNNLTNEQKSTDFGKAMASSLDQLKGRITQAKNELYSLKDESEKSGGVLDSLASKFGLNVKQLAGFGGAIAAASAALKVSKDVFMASEASVDEWGRTMDASKSLYEGFLTSLNTGDISGYLGRINEIVNAARQAYDELDRLGTLKTIQGPQVSAQQAENDRIRSMIQTGRYIAPLDGRNAAVWNGQQMKNGQLLTPEQIRMLERQLQAGTQKLTNLIGNEVKQTSKAIDAVYERQAKELGMSVSEFRKGTSSMSEFDKRLAEYDRYLQFERDHTTRTTIQSSAGAIVRSNRDNAINPYADAAKWGVFRVDGDRYNELVRLIQQRDQQAAQAYGMQSQSYRVINRAEGISAKSILNGETGGTGGKGGKVNVQEIYPEGSLKQLQQELKELQDAQSLVTSTEEWKRYQTQIDGVNKSIDALKGKVDTVDLLPDLDAAVEGVSPLEALKEKIRTELAEANSLIDETTLSTLLKATIENGLEGLDLDFTAIQEKMGEGLDIPDEAWEALQEKINEKLKELGIDPIQLDFSTGKESTKDESSFERNSQNTQKVVSGLQSVASGLQQMGVKLPESVQRVLGGLQGAMSIVQGVTSILQVFQGSGLAAQTISTNLNTSAVTALTGAVMANTIALSVNTGSQLVPFAKGGIVPKAANGYFVAGNSFSGDNTPILANAGELILNKASQGNLASQLQDSNRGATSTPYVSGEQIYMGMSNYLRRTGRGEILTAKM